MEGYLDKVDRIHRIHRQLSYRLHQSFVEKPIDIKDYSPIFGDNVLHEEPEELTQEFYEHIKHKYGIE